VTLDPTIFLENLKMKELNLESNKIVALNFKMFNRNDFRILRLENNKCVNDNLSGKDDSYVEMKLWSCNMNFHRMFGSRTLNCSYDDGQSCKSYYYSREYSDEEPRFIVTNLEAGRTPADITSVQFYYSTIYYVPASIFTYFTNLKQLHLNGSDIYYIRNNTFQNATDLLLIDLSHNMIFSLGPDTFQGATNLERIDLSSTQLLSIHGNVFRGLPNLSVLDLSNNFLDTLHASTFLSNTKLSSLDLSLNKIVALNSTMFQNFSNLSVNLQGNVCVNAFIIIRDDFDIEAFLAECNKNLAKRKICHRILV
jgi:Leucine-rich repeat (LRR) protein